MKAIITILLIGIFTVSKSQVKDFQGLDVRSNQSVSLNDYKSKKAVVVIFTSNVCPYSVYYEGRITQLVSDFNNEVQFLLVNSHKDDKESTEEMKNKISTWGINVPYIADKDGKIMQSFKARKSPEVYLLKSGSNGFSVFYKGAIDNNPQVASDVKDQYLKKNIQSLISGGSPSTQSTRPIGCMIK